MEERIRQVRLKLLASEKGLTLVELVVALILVGLIFPTIFSLAGNAAVKATKYIYMQKANYLAESKMEEIVGYKAQHWDWYKNISKFKGSETLPDGFTRNVSITDIKNWGNAQIKAWQIVVSVRHPQLETQIQLSVRLTKYFEYRK